VIIPARNEAHVVGKLIAALIDLVGELASAVQAHDEDLDEVVEELEDLREYIEEIDEDLSDVEDYLDEELEYDEYDELDEDDDDEDWLDDDEEGEYFEIECPSCGEMICFDESVEPENLTCPACGEKFSCEIEEDDLKAIDGDEDDE
jgi:formylmethanofuran dehydrogenase subunit E